MRREYDAFGRPVKPPTRGRADGSSGTPRAAGERSYGSPGAPRSPAGREDRAVVPEVRGLPTVGGGSPVRGSAEKRGARLLNAAGAVGVVILVLLGVLGSLVDDDDDAPPGRSGGATAAGRVAPLTAERATRAAGLLRSAMDPGARVVSVSISDASASARVLTADGTGTRSLTLDPDGAVSASPGSSAAPTSRGVAADDFETSAPGDVVEAVRRGLGPGATGTVRSVSAYSFRDEPLRWSASVEGGPEVARSWSADAAGRSVVRVRDGAPAPPEGEQGPATVPEGVSGRSLLVPENLRSGLGSLGALPALQDKTPREIRLTTLSVRPERLLAGVRDGAVRRLISVDAAFGLDPSGVGRSSDEDTVALSDVDPSGPARALREIGRRLSADAAAEVQSVALADVGGAAEGDRPGWFVLLGGEGRDRVWRATLDGRRVGRSGEDLTP